MDITTLSRVKSFDSPARPDTRDDEKLKMMITAISKKIEIFLGREILYTKRTELFNIDKYRKPAIWLSGYPVNTLTDALPARNATQQDVDDGYASTVGEAIAATANTLEFFNFAEPFDLKYLELNTRYGMVLPTQYEEFIGSKIQWGYDAFKATYWGGMARTTEDFYAKYPDIEYETIQQVLFEYKRSRNVTMVSVGAGGNSAETYLPFTLRDELKRALRPYRKTARV
tara:strand:- start:5678 stop:6361 length:684 start_codon:yes stop_codon:yes gene_type:complete